MKDPGAMFGSKPKPTNTPERRWALCNVPEAFEHSFHYESTHPWLFNWICTDPANPPGIVLSGPSQSGKTECAISLLVDAVHRSTDMVGSWNLITTSGKTRYDEDNELIIAPIWYERWPDFDIRTGRAMKASRSRSDVDGPDDLIFALIDNVAVLVIDDLEVGGPSPRKERFIASLIGARGDDKKRTIFVTAAAPNDFASQFGVSNAGKLAGRGFMVWTTPLLEERPSIGVY